MSSPYLGEIRILGFGFPPRGWAFCNGQLLSIQQNQALFALLGTFYGGNGTTTFALPNLQGRVPVHAGASAGPGLSPIGTGQSGGTETTTLSAYQLPAHSHSLLARDSPGTTTTSAPAGTAVLAKPVAADGTPINAYSNDAATTTMAIQSILPSGGGQPIATRDPYLALNFCIALQGIFPSRN